MENRKKYLFELLWLVFFLYGLNNFIFERQFFFNELLSVIGFILFICHTFFKKSDERISLPHSLIYKYVLGIIVLGIIQLAVSIPKMTNLYFYLRNSVIVYSIFTFFFGFYAFRYLGGFLKRIRKYLWVYILYALIFPSVALLERFMGAVFFPFLFKKYKTKSQLLIVLLSLSLAIRYESLTVVIVTLLVLFLFYLPSFKVFKYFAITSFIFIILAFIYLQPNLEKYKTPPYSLIGNIEEVVKSNVILRIDGNSTWRAVFWYRLAVERFPENLVGIGFGTPLLPYVKGMDTVPVEHDDEHDVHVSGAHNTYLTLSVRMGVFFLLIMTLLFINVFKTFYSNKNYFRDQDQLLYFYCFFTVAAVGLFNLVLESPTGASLFWGLLGVVAAVIYQKTNVKTTIETTD